MIRNKRGLKCSKNIILLLMLIIILSIFSEGVLEANNMEKWTILESYNVDLDNNNKPEKVVLSSEVEVDSSGNILWDDSQWWKLSVYNGKEEVLYKEYITLGNVYISIGTESGKKTPFIVWVNDTDDSLSILKFYYDIKNKKYKKENVLLVDKQVSSAIPNIYLKQKNNTYTF